MSEEASTSCMWCERPFRERLTGGRAQRFCQSSCRRTFHAAVRSWALDAVANGTLAVVDIRNGTRATRALRSWGEQLPSPPDTGSQDDALLDLMTRFLVEVPRHTIEAFVKFRFVEPHQQDDLTAIMAALKRIGRTPSISRIA